MRDGRGDLQPFDGAEHGNRRRDHPVAIEQRRARDADKQQRHATTLVRDTVCAAKSEQRHDTALAVIVGAHHEDNVFQGDDDRKRPEDKGKQAEHRRPALLAPALRYSRSV